MLYLTEFINTLTFKQVIWLLPIGYIIHFFEELPRFPEWANKNLKKPYTRTKFITENIVLWTLVMIPVLITTYFTYFIAILLILSAAAGFFMNMIFHVYFTVKTREYSPGTVTSCIIFVPISLIIFYLADKEGLLSLLTIILALVLGFIMLPIVVGIVHKVIDKMNEKKIETKLIFFLFKNSF